MYIVKGLGGKQGTCELSIPSVYRHINRDLRCPVHVYLHSVHLGIANVPYTIQIKLNYHPAPVHKKKTVQATGFLIAMLSLSAHYLWFWTKYIANKEKIHRYFYVASSQYNQQPIYAHVLHVAPPLTPPQMREPDPALWLSFNHLFFALWILAFLGLPHGRTFLLRM